MTALVMDGFDCPLLFMPVIVVLWTRAQTRRAE